METYNKMVTIVSAMESELQKFHDKHVKVSGKRVRAQCLEVKKLADTLRKEILAATALIEPQLHKAPKKHYLKKDPVETLAARSAVGLDLDAQVRQSDGQRPSKMSKDASTPVATPVETPVETSAAQSAVGLDLDASTPVVKPKRVRKKKAAATA